MYGSLATAVWICVNGTPHCNTEELSKPISSHDFDYFYDRIHLLSPVSGKEENQIDHWCVKHNLSRAAIHKLFRNPTMAIVGNFTLSLALFKRLRAMSYTIGIEFWKSGNVYYIWLADPNNHRNTEYTQFFYHNPVQYDVFFMQQPAFREHMLHPPAKEFNDTDKRIYLEMELTNSLWNELVR